MHVCTYGIVSLFTIRNKAVGEKSHGTIQGSILGHDLWNITYDDIFRIEMQDSAHLIEYADHVAAIIVARNVEEAKIKVNHAIRTKS